MKLKKIMSLKVKIIGATYMFLPFLGLTTSFILVSYEPRLLDGPYPSILQPYFFDIFLGISLWCISYVVLSLIFAIHKSLDKETLEELIGRGRDEMMIKIIWFPPIFIMTFHPLIKNIITNF
tara:strand:+ start:164 stop:529 length:366 start_codon:yes stop_codon:yes gene_type:complete